ncbi:MAG: YcjF family protein [Jhaorihella sp.]
MTRGPVLFDLDADETAPPVSVADAPPVPDPGEPVPSGRAMQAAARVAARRPSRLARWFWGLASALVGAAVSVAAWDFATRMLERAPLLGWMIVGLIAALLLVGLAIALREAAAIGRLGRIDTLRREADTVLAAGDLGDARAFAARLVAFYGGREDTRWGRERLAERAGEQFDAAAVLALAEDELLAPLDARASREVEAAARQVAAVTALVPIALADIATALVASLRMIRRVAEIYGGRSGFIGSWRLTRAVLSHLVATGAVAVGDDLLEPVLGGSILSKISRRFGEGLVNGALSARVGVAAMEVCRPLPFSKRHRPSVRAIVGRALGGLVPGRGGDAGKVET